MLRVWGNLDDIRNKHIEYCKPFILERIKQYTAGKILRSQPVATKQAIDSLLAIVTPKIESILGGDISELRSIDKELKRSNPLYSNYKDQLLRIFDYSFFSYTGLPFDDKPKKWGSYELIKSIGLITCPYCNESTIYTIYSKKSGKMRAELDHFLPKKKYPFFSLSFYNLIPSCASCNHLKKEQEIGINPFEDYFDADDRFVFNPNSIFIPYVSNGTNNFKFVFKSSDRIKKDQVKKMLIEERYNYHKDIVTDIYRNKLLYNRIYNDSLRHLFSELGCISEKDIHRMLFNVSPNPEEYHERPLSKLRNDILFQINSELEKRRK